MAKLHFRNILFNHRFLRERGLASNPKNGIPGFSLNFPKELSYGYLRFEEKNWDSQQGRPFSLSSQRNFPITFKPKVAIAKFVLKIHKTNLVLWKVGWTPCLFSF
jgi:hypothetical protein